MRRLAILLLLPACQLYFDPQPQGGTAVDGGVPADCDHPEYGATVLSPPNEAYVTDPVMLHWRWSEDSAYILDPYVKIEDDNGFNYVNGGTWQTYGPDDYYTIAEPYGVHLHVALGWFCHAGQPDEVGIELTRSYFTVMTGPVDGGV